MPTHHVKHKFNEWKRSNHKVLHKAHDYADLGYLLATLAEFHTAHLVCVAVLFVVGALHVIVIGDVESLSDE